MSSEKIKTCERNKLEPKWQAVADAVGGKEGVRIAEALIDLYSIYKPGMAEWFAGLFDPKIGGFYFSNSGRDNDEREYKGKIYKLLPNAESTSQSLGFVSGSGMMEGIDGRYPNMLPDWMNEKIKSFIYNLQDEDGYFYLPQWGKEINTSRRGRDLSWCTSMLRTYGVTPKYPTILDKKSAEGEKKVEEKKSSVIPEHLSSPEKFAEYLSSLDIKKRSYHVGNELSSQAGQIRAQGLWHMAVKFLEDNQNPDTGFWHEEINYYGVSGLMKISGFFTSDVPLPHALEAATSAFTVLISDELPVTIPILWNTWEAITRIIKGLEANGTDECLETIVKIRAMIIERAPEAIRKTKEKLLSFMQEDGGISCIADRSEGLSQEMPVGLKMDCPEGDVNATFIGSVLLINSIYQVLDLTDVKVPIFGAAERKRFLDVIEKNRQASL